MPLGVEVGIAQATVLDGDPVPQKWESVMIEQNTCATKCLQMCYEKKTIAFVFSVVSSSLHLLEIM